MKRAFNHSKRIYKILPKEIIKLLSLHKIRKIINSKEEICLDLGCGSMKRPRFIGIDLSIYADIIWDISWGIPFNDNSIKEIRSDHFFEHLELPVLYKTLQECYRVLVPGGILDFTVPHIDPYIKAYLKNDFNFIKNKIYDIPNGQYFLYSTCFDRISWLLLRSGEHKSCFDKRSIIEKLKKVGFKDVITRKYDKKRDINKRFSSIYIVAKK